MQRQQLIEEFISAYWRAATDPSSGPNPTLEELLRSEEELADVAVTLNLLELTDEQREQLRGLRVADLADLMMETADGLRQCKDVAEEIGTDPETFERVAELDLAAAALAVSLSIFHNCVDTGYLLRTAEAQRFLDRCNEEVARAQRAPASVISEDVKSAIEAEFGDAQSRFLVAERRAAQKAEGNQAALEAAQSQKEQALSKEERESRVRALIARVHNVPSHA